MSKSHLLADALAQVLETFAHVGWVVVGLVGVLAGRGQQLLVGGLERIDARFQLHVIMRQLRLLAGIARLLFEPLLAAGRERRHRGRDLVGEGAELVHVEGGGRG